MYGVYSAAAGAASQHGRLAGVGLAALFLAAVGCGVLSLIRSRTWENAALLALATLGGCAVHAVTPFVGLSIIYLVAWVAPFRARLWQAALITLLGSGGYVLVSIGSGLEVDATWGPAWGLVWVLVLGGILKYTVETRRRSAEVADARAREAVLDERRRLAREMHDILAHSLSAQIVHLEGARLLLERRGDTAQALQRILRAGDLARDGLAEAKRAVAALREDPVSLSEELHRLGEAHRADSGAECEVSATETGEALAPAAALLCARAAQEALTNVRKHAAGAEVSMSLRREEGDYLLEVADTGGDSGDLAGTGGGYGLVGLRERAESLGGSLEAEPAPPGFRVRLRVPA